MGHVELRLKNVSPLGDCSVQFDNIAASVVETPILVMEIVNFKDSLPYPNNCTSARSSGYCNIRSAYFACQNASPSFTCDIRVPIDVGIFLMRSKYGHTYDTSGRVNMKILYRNNITLEIEKGTSRCCWSCQDDDTLVDCSMMIFSNDPGNIPLPSTKLQYP